MAPLPEYLTPMLPTFIGIGAPKAGTTWLANLLAEHPEIDFSHDKEPDFFSYKYPENDFSVYEGLFDHARPGAAVGEFSTGYLTWEGVPERIYRHIPDVKLIVSFRNPVEQVYSHYWHLQRQNFHRWDPSLGALSFEDALVRFEDKLIGTALYADHVERWQTVFPPDQFAYVLFDDIKAVPEAVLDEVYAFVGVDPSWRPDAVGAQGSETRQGTSPRSEKAARVGAWVYDTLNQRVYHPLKQVVGTERAAIVKDALRVRPLFERVCRKKGFPAMRPDTRARLVERFAEPNRRLGEILGRDLSHWNE